MQKVYLSTNFTKLNENDGLPDCFTDYQIRHLGNPVFCPGLKKGTMLFEGKGHFRARNYILRALLRAELHFVGTFVRGIVMRRKQIIILLVQYSNHIFG